MFWRMEHAQVNDEYKYGSAGLFQDEQLLQLHLL